MTIALAANPPIHLDSVLSKKVSNAAARRHMSVERAIQYALERFTAEKDEAEEELQISDAKWAELKQAADDADKGIDVSGPFETMDEIRAHLGQFQAAKH